MDTIHINSDSPAQNDHALYPDGSKTKAGTRCGFCELNKGSIIFSWKRRLNESNSEFQAELTALHAAIIHSRRNGLNQVHIHTDSASSLQALSRMHSRSHLVNKIQRTLLSIPIPFRPVLCWVPVPVGILGNESADIAAKEAANSASLLECPTTLPTLLLKHSTCKLLIRQWQTSWNEATTGRRTHAMLPSVSMDLQSKTGSMSHFLTGRGPYKAYLHRFGLSNTDICDCGKVGSPHHYYFECRLTAKFHLKKNSTHVSRSVVE
ncbi:uncharacterized protein LOC118198823 [Stegodyphus dumicola]|uniref:uncharacterized protein LOC118198823 n=1 Tax=Stegodyphus dumicola TaxID=202533 RepID=UPI0015AFB7EE|nr:uncharacterized protein LOC118198823 [Stegodyphus dumicola]